MPKWTITYHTITQESAENGDYDDHGFLCANPVARISTSDYMADLALIPDAAERAEHVQKHYAFESLKAALRYVHPVWDSGQSFDEETPNTNYRTGEDEYRQLHLPKGITASSRRRLKRVLGVRS